jgi:hypothetical protein
MRAFRCPRAQLWLIVQNNTTFTRPSADASTTCAAASPPKEAVKNPKEFCYDANGKLRLSDFTRY